MSRFEDNVRKQQAALISMWLVRVAAQLTSPQKIACTRCPAQQDTARVQLPGLRRNPGDLKHLRGKPPSSPDRQLAEDGQHESLQQAVAEDLNRGRLKPRWWRAQAKDMLHRGTLLQRAA